MQKPLNFIDSFLNSITMYRLMLYGLGAISICAILLGFAGIVTITSITVHSQFATGLLMSTTLAIFLCTCYGMNRWLGKIYNAPINAESSAITAFILFCIVSPISNISDIPYIIAAAVLAMLSKYLLVTHKRHLFNPAAIAVVIAGLGGHIFVNWWIGSAALLPITLIVGLLVVRKIRRFNLFFSFLGSSLVMLSIMTIIQEPTGSTLGETLLQSLTSWPLIFFATIMLTEPLTTPPTFKTQILYGIFVGILMPIPFSIGPLFNTPELSLVIGNLFAYAFSTKRKYTLSFAGMKKESEQIYDFAFTHTEPITFTPGQYAEWTLHDLTPDSRGNRRYFTIASAPTEKQVHLGVRISPNGSSFKKMLSELKHNNHVVLSAIAGDFVLPTDTKQKLVLVAGGVGITPFRSMIKYILDKNETRDIVLLYAANTENDFVYTDIFNAATQVGVTTHYLVTNPQAGTVTHRGTTSTLDETLIAQLVPDYADRHFYVSGPNIMVTNYKKMIKKLGVGNSAIKTDYFPGF